ncbi:galectin-5-like [Notamacropus eugenii]|uniref:galectin-5-like n=1 Tax=Notamacropus eugenii TaxID=9315 RepID=UPI003B678136
MPFQRGAPFEIHFHVQSTGFNVTVNGNHFVHYNHRVPLKSVDTIMINGIVSLSCVSIQAPCFPTVPPSEQKYILPFYVSIPGGLSPGKSMIVNGSVLPSAYWFVINLRCGNDIALHLNPRFQDNVVIRTNQSNGTWGPEERSLLSDMPFIRGQTFQVWLLCDAVCLKAFVNGKHLFDYNHRVKNLPSINVLEVAGDIHLTYVKIE